jgi:hypothetical protein
MISARAYDLHVDQLFDKMRRIHAVLDAAGIPYRIVGGVAVFLHVSERDPEKARMTRDLDLAVQRDDMQRIAVAAEQAGFPCRDAASGSAIHFVFAPDPLSDPVRSAEGILLAPVSDLVRMKLTTFRLKDKVHIQDMDSVGLITAEIEQALPESLRERLKEVRATE